MYRFIEGETGSLTGLGVGLCLPLDLEVRLGAAKVLLRPVRVVM